MSYAAQEAAFNRAQRAYEARTEPEPDWDDDAPQRDDAEDDLMRTHIVLLQALCELVPNTDTVHDVAVMSCSAYDPSGKCPGELLAVVINSNHPHCIKAAAYELRERIRAHIQRDVDQLHREREQMHAEALQQRMGGYADDCDFGGY
jgi:hypothetical protein